MGIMVSIDSENSAKPNTRNYFLFRRYKQRVLCYRMLSDAKSKSSRYQATKNMNVITTNRATC
jgi:hypothetical protein